MSWGALPFWFYQIEYEQYEMHLLGAMHWKNCNEAHSGSSRSMPDYNHWLFSLKGKEDEDD